MLKTLKSKTMSLLGTYAVIILKGKIQSSSLIFKGKILANKDIYLLDLPMFYIPKVLSYNILCIAPLTIMLFLEYIGKVG